METATERTHHETARAIARETGWDLDEHADDHGWTAVGVGPVGHHRDSDALARSNWEVIHGDLSERFGEAVAVARFRHWAVGWVEELTWDAGRDDVRRAVQDWRDALDRYPVADEDHYSALELEETVELLTDWYGVPETFLDDVLRDLPTPQPSRLRAHPVGIAL